MQGKKQNFNISLSEYPREVCLVLYHSPCFLHCNWCFNKNNLKNTLLNFKTSVEIIKENEDFITSVCLSGGEPFLSSDFYDISNYVKEIGLKLKINTSGIVTPQPDLFTADYINISFKGNYSDYKRYGYKHSEETLKNNITILSDHKYADKVEWSVVYHPLIVDLSKVKDLMYSLNCKCDYFTLNQLQIGDCYDDFINDFTPPNRAELLKQLNSFKNIPLEHCLIESKEFGREIII